MAYERPLNPGHQPSCATWTTVESCGKLGEKRCCKGGVESLDSVLDDVLVVCGKTGLEKLGVVGAESLGKDGRER